MIDSIVCKAYILNKKYMQEAWHGGASRNATAKCMTFVLIPDCVYLKMLPAVVNRLVSYYMPCEMKVTFLPTPYTYQP